MTEVIPGIYQLKLPLPDEHILLGYINAYLVRGKEGHLLVDTGWEGDVALESLRGQLTELGIDLKEIRQIVSTHTHIDHYGLGKRLREISGATLAIHQEEKRLFADQVSMETLLRRQVQWFRSHGVPERLISGVRQIFLNFLESVRKVQPDITLQGGETISTGLFNFTVLWTPGHAPGHICFYEPDRKILLSGDHILPTITPNISQQPQSDNPLGAYINSLKALKPLEVNLVLPAHENPFTGLDPRIDQLIEHHQARNSEIMRTMGDTPTTAYQIATRITWMSDIEGVGYEKLSPLDKRLAVLETLAHLEFMRAEGRVIKLNQNGTIYYQSA